MPNCSIEAKQKVVSLYHEGYSLFSIRRLRLFQKALVGILFEDIIPADMTKIEKVRVDRKIWILKRKKFDKIITE